MYSQENQGKWEMIFREDEKGNLMSDSVLILSPGQKPPADVRSYEYRDNKGRLVTANGRYEYIYREGENNDMIRDSVLIDD